ncbi:N-acetylglucosamine-6-phosphate deacetylase [Vagococcus hydrophili]|uniref:N-acetylglucosamine-6-phosphate deacetylase n=1 Tax=Vagococcus hydrophili TaxID=2714947 RepID=A0A6G8ASF4_9ENTE|nr:N-acetylglucosamine-6-phosphate deacetylase [Vagococcus hydrophili]QIL47855.1 N-acetylglucosamine-6-phosphate deacetylase [Vagococcus hydrophili]
MQTLLKQATIINNNKEQLVDIIIENQLIKNISTASEEINPENFDHIINLEKQLLIPGMIDVHIHGANHYDMMDGTTKSIQEVSKKCLETGCTGFLVTSVTSSLEQLLNMIAATKKVIGKEEGAKILGIHLEGPYLNPIKKGMQDPNYLRLPDLTEIKNIVEQAEGLIKMVTIAPELPGTDEVIDYLIAQNIVVAAGHTNATYEEAQDAFNRGINHITHCCNAMPAIHHRSPGITTAALEDDRVSIQAIIDNVHLHPGMVRLMHKTKQANNMVLITDALQAMGVGDGHYHFGGHEVTVKEGIATLKDGTLASSTVTMNQALKISTEMGIPLGDSIEMAAKTPSNLLSCPTIGVIQEGYDADLIALDENFNVSQIFLKGIKK